MNLPTRIDEIPPAPSMDGGYNQECQSLVGLDLNGANYVPDHLQQNAFAHAPMQHKAMSTSRHLNIPDMSYQISTRRELPSQQIVIGYSCWRQCYTCGCGATPEVYHFTPTGLKYTHTPWYYEYVWLFSILLNMVCGLVTKIPGDTPHPLLPGASYNPLFVSFSYPGLILILKMLFFTAKQQREVPWKSVSGIYLNERKPFCCGGPIKSLWIPNLNLSVSSGILLGPFCTIGKCCSERDLSNEELKNIADLFTQYMARYGLDEVPKNLPSTSRRYDVPRKCICWCIPFAPGYKQSIEIEPSHVKQVIESDFFCCCCCYWSASQSDAIASLCETNALSKTTARSLMCGDCTCIPCTNEVYLGSAVHITSDCGSSWCTTMDWSITHKDVEDLYSLLEVHMQNRIKNCRI